MYQSLDPEKNRLVVSRDVVFEEHLPWEWGKSTDTSLSDPDTFIVEYQSTDENPTTAVTEAEFDFDGVEPLVVVLLGLMLLKATHQAVPPLQFLQHL